MGKYFSCITYKGKWTINSPWSRRIQKGKIYEHQYFRIIDEWYSLLKNPEKNGNKELSDKFGVLLEKGAQWKPIIHIYFE